MDARSASSTRGARVIDFQAEAFSGFRRRPEATGLPQLRKDGLLRSFWG